jgi:hypothetical protein
MFGVIWVRGLEDCHMYYIYGRHHLQVFIDDIRPATKSITTTTKRLSWPRSSSCRLCHVLHVEVTSLVV